MQRMMNALGVLLVVLVALSECSIAQTTCNQWNCNQSVPWTMQSAIFNFPAPNQGCKVRADFRFRKACNNQYLEILGWTWLTPQCHIRTVDLRADLVEITRYLMANNPMGFSPLAGSAPGSCDTTTKVGMASCFSYDYRPDDTIRYYPCDGVGCCTISYTVCIDSIGARRYIASGFTSSNISCIDTNHQNGGPDHHCVASCPQTPPRPGHEHDPELSWDFVVPAQPFDKGRNTGGEVAH